MDERRRLLESIAAWGIVMCVSSQSVQPLNASRWLLLFFRVVAKLRRRPLHRQPGIAVITESRLENHQTGSLDRAQINLGTSERVFGVKCVVIAHWKLRFALSYYWAMIVPRISAVARPGMICCTLESPS
jgi:hypothetical protein